MSWKQIFDHVGMDQMTKKQYLLTGYLEYLLDHLASLNNHNQFEIMTPRDPEQRGNQLSLVFSASLERVHQQLQKRGVVVIK